MRGMLTANPWDRVSALGQKRTLKLSRAMSALCQKRTFGSLPTSFLGCTFGSHLNWKHYLKSCTAPGIRLRDDTTAVELNNHSRYRKPQSRSLIFSCNKRIKNFRRALLFEARPRILHRYSDFTLILPFSLKS